MIVQFGAKSLDCKHLELTTPHIREGDLIVSQTGELFKVETIQRDCPSIENLSHIFTHWILRDEENKVICTRSIFGVQEVYRTKKQS